VPRVYGSESERILSSDELIADVKLAREYVARILVARPHVLKSKRFDRARACGFKFLPSQMRWQWGTSDDNDDAVVVRELQRWKEARNRALSDVKIVYLVRQDCVSAELSLAEMHSKNSARLRWHHGARSAAAIGQDSETDDRGDDGQRQAVTLSDAEIGRACDNIAR
jgi:hypothetical protein